MNCMKSAVLALGIMSLVFSASPSSGADSAGKFHHTGRHGYDMQVSESVPETTSTLPLAVVATVSLALIALVSFRSRKPTG